MQNASEAFWIVLWQFESERMMRDDFFEAEVELGSGLYKIISLQDLSMNENDFYLPPGLL